jgi:hypothetical protein
LLYRVSSMIFWFYLRFTWLASVSYCKCIKIVIGLGNVRSKWESLGLDFWSKVGNGSQYYELDTRKETIAKCSRMHNVSICALKHNPNSFCSSRMAPHYVLNWGLVHLKKYMSSTNGDIMKMLVEVFEYCNVPFHCYVTFSWSFFLQSHRYVPTC